MTTHPNLCNSADSLLLIVDIQPRLTAVMAKAEAEKMVSNCGSLIEASKLLEIPILLTEQYPKGLGNTEESLTARLGERHRIFDKTGFSCCAAGGFEAALEKSGRKQIILAGQEAHVCVLQTALELRHKGYHPYVVEDAVCSRSAEHKFYALERMRQHGVTISNFESVLFEWLRDAAHPEFKALSALLR